VRERRVSERREVVVDTTRGCCTRCAASGLVDREIFNFYLIVCTCTARQNGIRTVLHHTHRCSNTHKQTYSLISCSLSRSIAHTHTQTHTQAHTHLARSKGRERSAGVKAELAPIPKMTMMPANDARCAEQAKVSIWLRRHRHRTLNGFVHIES